VAVAVAALMLEHTRVGVEVLVVIVPLPDFQLPQPLFPV